MGRKTRNKYIDDGDDNFTDDDEYYNESQYNTEMKDSDIFWNFMLCFEKLIYLNNDFCHLEKLGASYVYYTIKNEYRPNTILFNFSPIKHRIMNESQYYFWYILLKILNKPIEKAQLMHNLLGI